MISREQVEELRKLEKSMSVPPWSIDYLYGAIRHIERNVDIGAFVSEGWSEKGGSPGKYDGTALAQLRNAIPELLDTLDAALKVIAAAKKFKHHNDINHCGQCQELRDSLLPFTVPRGGGMREIKFRAWDKVERRWIRWDKIQFKGCGRESVQGKTPDGYIFTVWTDENVEVMQFTGLRDKNGKEIYEGDLLNDATHHPKDFPPLVVEYEPYSGGWKPFAVTTFAPRGVIVIGNIHENPELLK